LQFRCQEVSEEKIKDILKTTSDYQYDNITIDELYGEGNTMRVTVSIYANDLNDQARTRDALHKLIDSLLK